MTGSDNNSGGQGHNPSWDEFFNAIPEDYREQLQPNLTPVLQKWDQNVQKRFEDYKPYERYIKGGVDPQVIDYGVNLLNKLESDDGAMEVFGQLGQYLEQQGLLSQEDGDEDEDGDFDYNSLPAPLRRQIEQLQEGYGVLAEHNLMQEQARQEAMEDAALDSELSRLKKEYGEYDDDWVLAKMSMGIDAEDAVRAYQEWYEGVVSARKPAPFRPIGVDGGMPGTGQFDTKKASNRETQDHVAQLLFDTFRNK